MGAARRVRHGDYGAVDFDGGGHMGADARTDDDGLRALLDERAIIRTMHRYCRALDDGLHAEWRDVFTEDAVYDTYLPNGDVYVHLIDRDGFAAFLDAYPRRPVTAPKHVMVDPIIDIDGDAATAESTFLYLNQSPGELPQIVAWGRYIDRFRREDGVWRIAERRCDTEAVAG